MMIKKQTILSNSLRKLDKLLDSTLVTQVLSLVNQTSKTGKNKSSKMLKKMENLK